MKIIPQWRTNLKYWRVFNQIVFGKYLSCPKCGHISMKENYESRYLWCGHCRTKHRYSAHRGSFLYGCKLQPIQLYQLLWCFVKQTSIETIRTVTGLSYTTIERWLYIFRRSIRYSPQEDSKLSGLVKIDESFFGKRKSRQSQVIVVGAIEADTRRIRLEKVTERSKEVLEEFVGRNIESGSTIVSDKWSGYEDLWYNGYDHIPFNHHKGEWTHTNQIEGLWSEIKRSLRRIHGKILIKDLDLILTEWMCRLNQPEVFESPEKFLQRVVQGWVFHVS